MNPNILILNSLYYPDIKGGAEHSIKYLVEALNEKYKVYVLCFSKKNETVEEVVNGVYVKRVPIKNIYNPFYDTKKLKSIWHLIDSFNPFYKNEIESIVHERNISLVITNNLVGFSPKVFSEFVKLGKPVIHILRDYNLLCPSSLYHKETCEKICSKCKAFQLIKRKFTHEVSTVIGISEFILKKHKDYGLFKSTDSEVIPNAIALEKFISTNNIVEKTEYDFGYIGRITENKGIFDLIELLKNLGGITLSIAGSIDPQIINYYSNFKNIHFLGYVDNTNFFSKNKFTVVPSKWYEPFGRVVIESFAAGRPVIARKIGGLQELIKHGNNGFLFESDSDLIDLVRHCKNLSIDKYKKMVENARIEAKKYDVANIKSQYLKLIESFRED